MSGSQNVTVIVNKVNTPPRLEKLADKLVENTSGATVTFDVSAQDDDVPTNTLTFSNVTYTDLNSAPYTATYKLPAVTGGRIRQYGTYAQDNWTVNNRLTLNLGVRCLRDPITADGIHQRIERYDARDAAETSRLVRASADRNDVLKNCP